MTNISVPNTGKHSKSISTQSVLSGKFAQAGKSKLMTALAFTGVMAGAVMTQSTSTLADDYAWKTISYDYKDFSKLDLHGSMKLKVTEGEYAITIKLPEKDEKRIDIKQDKQTMFIETPKNREDSENPPVLTISMPDFNSLVVRGAADGVVEDIDAEKVNIEIRGAANLILDGTCNVLDVEIRGAGNVEARDLKCEDVTVELLGAGNTEIFASTSVEAKLRGVGHIDIYGDPKNIDKRVFGIGAIDIHK